MGVRLVLVLILVEGLGTGVPCVVLENDVRFEFLSQA